jgi:hypothetical protein
MPSSGTPQQQQQQQSGAGPYSAAAAAGRKLVIPAPAFIPLEAPEALVKAAAEADGGDTAAAAAAGGGLGFGSSAAVKKIEPEVLVEQVGLGVSGCWVNAVSACSNGDVLVSADVRCCN